MNRVKTFKNSQKLKNKIENKKTSTGNLKIFDIKKYQNITKLNLIFQK